MDPVIELILDKYKEHYGPMTSEEAMTLAVEADEHCCILGPFDPAYGYFNRERGELERYAYLLSANGE